MNLLETVAAYHTPKAKSISIASALKVIDSYGGLSYLKIARRMFLTSTYTPGSPVCRLFVLRRRPSFTSSVSVVNRSALRLLAVPAFLAAGVVCGVIVTDVECLAGCQDTDGRRPLVCASVDQRRDLQRPSLIAPAVAKRYVTAESHNAASSIQRSPRIAIEELIVARYRVELENLVGVSIIL
jgi:hypothetical protein